MATCRFLENLTLASLVAPVTEEELQTQYWEQKPLVVHRNDPDDYGDFFTVNYLDRAIASSPEYIKINIATNAGQAYSDGAGLGGRSRRYARRRHAHPGAIAASRAEAWPALPFAGRRAWPQFRDEFFT